MTSQGVFVGREGELAALVALLDEREPVAVVVRGDAGVGKTRLVERFLGVARARGWEPAVGHCEPLAAGLLPAGALLEAVRGAAPAGPGAHDVHARLLALATGPAPAVLVLEDVHWADALTLGAVPYLLRAAAGRRLVVVLTLRTDEPRVEQTTRSHLAELDRCGARRLTVPPLDAAATRALALALGGPVDEPAVARLHERSGGNPFYLEELVRSGAAESGLPESVREQVVDRLARLPAAVLRVVGRVGVAARPVCHDLLAALDGVEPVELVEPLRLAHAAGVLVAHPDLTYSFRHGLVREAVVAQMLPAERRDLHRRMAETLAAPQAPRPTDRAEAAALAAEIAHHWRATADTARAVDAAVAAGTAALRVPAPDEARAQFERALAEWDDASARRGGLLRAEVEQRAAETALLVGDAVRAARHLRAAIAAHGSGGPADPVDPVVLGTLHHQLGRSLHQARAARTEVDAAYRRARHLVPLDETGARTEVEVGHLLLELSRGRGAGELVDRADTLVARARAAGDPSAEASALFALTRALDLDGQPQRAVRVLEQAVERADGDDDPELLGRASGALGSLLARRGEFGRAADVVLPVLARLGEEASRTVGATLAGTAATALVELGRWPEADELLGRPGATAVRTTAGALPLLGATPSGGTGLATSQVVTLVALTTLDLLRGRADAAGQRLDAERRASAPAVQEACRVLDLRAAAWRGDVDGARRAFLDIAPVLLRGDRPLPPPVLAEIVGDVLRAVADAGPGRRGTGPDVLPDADRLLAGCRPDDAWGRAVLAGTRAERLRVEHRSAAVAEWRAALDGFDRAGAAPRAAYARWRLAEALLARRSAEGPVELRRAAVDATALGMAALTGRIEATARAARVPVDGDAVPRVPEYGLTGREQQVLHLLVTGRTNKQIAAELFISDRTAGTHVSRVLAKLGANNRAQATAMWLRTAERGGGHPVPSPRRGADDPAGTGRRAAPGPPTADHDAVAMGRAIRGTGPRRVPGGDAVRTLRTPRQRRRTRSTDEQQPGRTTREHDPPPHRLGIRLRRDTDPHGTDPRGTDLHDTDARNTDRDTGTDPRGAERPTEVVDRSALGTGTDHLRPVDRREELHRQKAEFGGIKWGSAFFGWLTAIGTAVLLTGLATAVLGAIGLAADPAQVAEAGRVVQNPAAAQTTGIVSAVVALVVLFVAYYCGGYVAGRMARFSGAKQGVAVWVWTVVISLLVGIAVAVAGTQLGGLAGLGGLPQIPIDPGALTVAGIITALLALAVSLVGAVLGGLAGMRFHRRIDRADLTV